jgi:sugar diacid utilization regulator
MADAALVELVLSGHGPSAERRRALGALGLRPQLPMRVGAVAVSSTCDPATEALTLAACGSSTRSVRVAVVGGLAVMLFQHGLRNDSPARDMCQLLRQSGPFWPVDRSVRVGVGGKASATAARESWEQAVLALRFATPSTSGPPPYPVRAVVDYEVLGVFALLAKIPGQDLRDHGDMSVLDALADTDTGAMDLEALQAFCRTGTLRSAAEALYVHHSTVADRLARAEAALGWRLDDPAGRLRAQLALCARRLAESQP